MTSGYRIDKLRLIGEAVEAAEVAFYEGTNIISGPSNTGKTFVFQCINYMLGSSTVPKGIKQADPYSKIYLEITSFDEVTYTLESDLKGGDFNLYDGGIDEITFGHSSITLSRKHNPKSEDTISAFLLKLNKIYSKKIRTNAKGKTRQISYRDIIRYLMINEERIITEASVIVSHYTKGTEEKNVLKYLVSGNDDSDIVTVLSKTEVTNRKGRLELLKELIIEEGHSIEQLTRDANQETIDSITNRIDELKKSYQRLSEEYAQLNAERKKLITSSENANRRRRELQELYRRSSLLKNHYETDILRLKSTIEASILLRNVDNGTFQCPLCKSDIPHQCDESDIDSVIASCEAEIDKIVALLVELSESVSVILEDSDQVGEVLEGLNSQLIVIEEKIQNDLEANLAEILDSIDSLSEKRSHLLGINAKQVQLQKYLSQKEKLEEILREARPQNSYETLSTANMSSVSEQVERVLAGINYPDLVAVSYSEESADFVISGEDRRLFGKGYRAIIYASFIVALQEFLTDKDYSIGVPVLDSPLVTYKKPDSGNEEIPIDLAMDFYRYVSTNEKVNQIIIIENEEPPEDILGHINHIVFTRSNSTGRYGFFPV